jgi:hypothetical protein
MTARSSGVFAFVVLSALVVVAGCSGPNKGFSVKGSVSYQGKPLRAGWVRLHMADDRMAMAMIQSDGSFEATDVLPGEAKVTVEMRQTKMDWKAPPKGAALAFRRKQQKRADQLVSLPVKYKDINTSGLVFSLVPGERLEIRLD